MKLSGYYMKAMGALAVAIILAAGSSARAASDCPNTAWEPANGRTCANLGLSSNRSVCGKGAYALACDDTRDSIRICRTTRSCAEKQPAGAAIGAFALPRMFDNVGRNGDYITYRGRQFHCTDWNFRKQQPCPSGRRNPDCKGDCR